MHNPDKDRQARDRLGTHLQPTRGAHLDCSADECSSAGSAAMDQRHKTSATNCAGATRVHRSQLHLSSFGSTKGWHFAKIRSEKNDTAWATLRYACDDSETAVRTPIRRSLRMNSKISNLVHSCSDAARGRGTDCKCKRVCEQSYGHPKAELRRTKPNDEAQRAHQYCSTS